MSKLIYRFPEMFQEYKRKSGKTQVQIAVEWGIDPATLSRYINAHNQSIHFGFLEAVCKGMGVKPGDILDWEDGDEG